jgi:hypothetical protein
MLHIDTFAHNKSGIAYQDKSRRLETGRLLEAGPVLSGGCRLGLSVTASAWVAAYSCVTATTIEGLGVKSALDGPVRNQSVHV